MRRETLIGSPKPKKIYTSLVERRIPDLVTAALQGAKKIFTKDFKYRKVGVMLMGLEPLKGRQFDLLSSRHEDKREKLMATLDKINSKLGLNSVFHAAGGIKQEWKMMRTMKSQNYTTKWDELPCAL